MSAPILLAAIFGLLVGSFLSVCIYRIPAARKEKWGLEDEEKDLAAPDTPDPDANLTVMNPPRSFCPKCRSTLSWYHNIPLFSWIFLRGKCAFCSAPIPARYPLVELATAILAAATVYKFGVTPTAAVIFAFCASLIVISVIDYDLYIIPDIISLPGTLAGIAVGIVNQFYPIFGPPIAHNLMASLLGILAGAGFLYVVSEVYMKARKREGLGFGDVKLLAMTGAFFGFEGSFFTIFVGSMLGAVLGITAMLLRGRSLSQHLPFGPYLAGATILFIFVGPEALLPGPLYIP